VIKVNNKEKRTVSDDLLDRLGDLIDETKIEEQGIIIDENTILKFSRDLERLHDSGLFGKDASFSIQCGALLKAMYSVIYEYFTRNHGEFKKRTPLFVILCLLFVRAWEKLDDVTKQYYSSKYKDLERIYVELKKVFDRV
jgi:membrane-associated HD superfamily phosphohydrolase